MRIEFLISLILLILINYSLARPNNHHHHKGHGHNLDHLRKYISSSSEDFDKHETFERHLKRTGILRRRARRDMKSDWQCNDRGEAYTLPDRDPAYATWCACDPHYAGRYCLQYATYICKTDNDCLESKGPSDFTCQETLDSGLKYCLPNPKKT